MYQFTDTKSCYSCPKLWLPGASRVLGIIPAPLSRALEPESEEKDVCLFQVLSNMHHVSSDLVMP